MWQNRLIAALNLGNNTAIFGSLEVAKTVLRTAKESKWHAELVETQNELGEMIKKEANDKNKCAVKIEGDACFIVYTRDIQVLRYVLEQRSDQYLLIVVFNIHPYKTKELLDNSDFIQIMEKPLESKAFDSMIVSSPRYQQYMFLALLISAYSKISLNMEKVMLNIDEKHNIEEDRFIEVMYIMHPCKLFWRRNTIYSQLQELVIMKFLQNQECMIPFSWAQPLYESLKQELTFTIEIAE